MIKKLFKLLILPLLVLIIGSYIVPVKQIDFFKTYAKTDKYSKSLKEFQERPIKYVVVNNIKWQYYKGGKGTKTILFLHGMGGAYDLWWQQINAFENDYKIISYSLPEEINSLEQASKGILQILETENIDKFYAVGTSMGGYIAQYLVKTVPNRIEKVVFGNTFPPNDLIRTKNKSKSKIIPFLPVQLISYLGKKQLNKKIIPAANNSKLLAAFLPSLPFSKKQFINRYAIVVDKFKINPLDIEVNKVSKLIMESDNDPLVEVQLRESLKKLYPNAKHVTFHKKGHFPYINTAETYNKVLKKFFDETDTYTTLQND